MLSIEAAHRTATVQRRAISVKKSFPERAMDSNMTPNGVPLEKTG